jgi:hypothetical protein
VQQVMVHQAVVLQGAVQQAVVQRECSFRTGTPVVNWCSKAAGGRAKKLTERPEKRVGGFIRVVAVCCQSVQLWKVRLGQRRPVGIVNCIHPPIHQVVHPFVQLFMHPRIVHIGYVSENNITWAACIRGKEGRYIRVIIWC